MHILSSPTLLTIAIPTFNRLNCLKLLLESIMIQLKGLDILNVKLEILICNNASTDETSDYLDSISVVPGITIFHHVTNCGADSNIVYCCKVARGKYVWIMGDDDLPMKGTIVPLLEFLEFKNPDLLYLSARWENGELTKYLDVKAPSVGFTPVSNMGLAVCANIYVTFISSWIMNMELYRQCVKPPQFDRFMGTSLSQLEWILTLLGKGKELYFSKNDLLIARAGNSGNYALFEVFSKNFNDVVDKKFPKNEKIGIFLKRSMLWCFLPGLIWGVRNNRAGSFGKFDGAKIFSILDPAYGDNRFFSMLVVPMLKYRFWWANFFRYAARISAKTWLFLCKKKFIVN